jgi:molybdopterin-guanine dinucleotide biosynthesis protein A
MSLILRSSRQLARGNPLARRRPEPIGVVLAGGSGRRLGGSKAIVRLRGAPLISYPLAAMRAVLRDVAVIAKPQTELPSLQGVTVWIESTTTSHPLAGLIEALWLAAGRPVLSCPLDLPFVTPELIRALARADAGGRPAVVATCRGAMQPLLGCYQPRAAALLQRPNLDGVVPGEAVAEIGPRLFEVSDEDLLFNVDAPEDLLTAAAMLDRPSWP